MFCRINSKKFIVICLIFSLILAQSSFVFRPVFSRSSQEIEDERLREEARLKETQSEISKRQKELEGLGRSANDIAGSIPALESEINRLQKELELNILLEKEAKAAKNLKELEKAHRELQQKESVKLDYIDWRFNSTDVYTFFENEIDTKISSFYQSKLVEKQSRDIFAVSENIKVLSEEIDRYGSLIKDIKNKEIEIQNKKRELEARLAYLNSQIAGGNSAISNLRNNAKKIQSNISFLSAEQRIAEERERALLIENEGRESAGGGVYSDSFSSGSGNFVFFGRGRDIYQGHGVGMSQWGAHGMAQRGWNYRQILNFYYTGTSLVGGYENRTINVSGYGNMSIEDYTAGQVEVPAKACGNAEQVAQRPDKFVLAGGSQWSCWPEETIKAQVVAFRTYALHYVRNGRAICTTTACQVFNPNQNSRWAVDETRGEVLTAGGALIETLYSAENNQGFGTAHSDTIFQNFEGNGSYISYLRAVNDTDLATKTSWHSWTYRSNQYNLGYIENFVRSVANNSSVYGSVSGHFSSVINSLGSIVGITTERDPSLRVKKVVLRGANGEIRSIGGYWFKYAWNIYVNSNGVRRPDGSFDYIYSQTYFLHSN